MNNTTYELVDEELMNFIKVCGTLKTLPMKAKENPIDRRYCLTCRNWQGGNHCMTLGEILNTHNYYCSFYKGYRIKPKTVRTYRSIR